MKDLPKRVRRQIATEEHIREYFRRVDRDYQRRWRLAQIQLRRPQRPIEILQVVRVRQTGDGLLVEVR